MTEDGLADQQELNMQVFCRVRPSHRGELLGGNHNAVELDTDGKQVRVASKQYSFDSIFDAFSHNDVIFQRTCEQHIEHAFNGFCGTLMCYGQTGTGKTHTMSCRNQQDEGILLQSVRSVFSKASQQSAKSGRKIQVRFNYVQLYRDNLQDLLNPDTPFLKFKREEEEQTGDNSVVRGVTWTPPLHNFDEFMRHYVAGDKHRVVAETKMNKQSSRGHSVMSLSITQLAPQDVSQARDINGQLVFVDLAGYERMKKTMVDGLQKDEAKHINLSLSALAGVIHALTMGSPHVPWRNSKLTQLLKRSISGNSITSVILTIGPSSAHVAETINTLYFGHNALQCKTTVHVNLGELDYKKEYATLSSAVKQLKQQLSETSQKLVVANEKPNRRNDAVSSTERETLLQDKVDQLNLRCQELEEQNNIQEQQIIDADIIITEAEAELEDWRDRYLQLKEKEERMQKAAAQGDEGVRNHAAIQISSDLQAGVLDAKLPMLISPSPPRPPPPPPQESSSNTESSASTTSAPSDTTPLVDTSESGSTLLESDISFQSTSSEAEDEMRQQQVDLVNASASPLHPAAGAKELRWNSASEAKSRKVFQYAIRHLSTSDLFVGIGSVAAMLRASQDFTSQLMQRQRDAAQTTLWTSQRSDFCDAADALDSDYPTIAFINVEGRCVEGDMLDGSWVYQGGSEGKSIARWIRFKTAADISDEQATIVGNGRKYQVSTSDIGSILAFEIIPQRSDGVYGLPMAYRVRSIVQSCEPRVTNLRIAGEPLLSHELCAQYGFEGGVEGRSILRWYKSYDGQRFVQFFTSTTSKSLIVDADLVHHYIRVQVTPIRCDGVKGNIIVSKLVYVNVDDTTDEKLLRCLLRGEVSFSISVLQVEGTQVVEGSGCPANLTVSTDELVLKDENETRRMQWREGHPMLTPATHLQGHARHGACIWWMEDDFQLLVDTGELELRDVILLIFRAFFCASRPPVIADVFGEMQEALGRGEAEDTFVTHFQAKKLDRLLTPAGDFRPGSHFTFLSQLEESLLHSEEQIVGTGQFSIASAKLPVVILVAHTVCF